MEIEDIRTFLVSSFLIISKEGANMKTTETIYETYIRTLCSNCKNRDLNLCEIRKTIKGTLKCCYYIKDKDIEGYKKDEIITAKKEKPIMRM